MRYYIDFDLFSNKPIETPKIRNNVSKRQRIQNVLVDKEFNEKIFRSSLCYFKDIDYSEKTIFQKGFNVSDSAIKKSLIKFSVE